MSRYFVIKLDGTAREISSPSDFNGTPKECFLIIKDETTKSYYATYTVIDKSGEPAPYMYGDYQVKGYETCGRQADYMLKIFMSYKGHDFSHVLHKDARWGFALTSKPYFDNEWESGHPEKAVIRFLLDCASMGYEARIQIDSLKRDLFTTKRDLANANGLNTKRRTICEGAEIIVIPDGVEFINGDQFDDCSRVRRIIIPETVTQIVCSAFNWKQNLKEVVFLGTRVISLIPPLRSEGIVGSEVTSTGATFYVEDCVVNTYQNDFCWKCLADKIHPISELKDYTNNTNSQ